MKNQCLYILALFFLFGCKDNVVRDIDKASAPPIYTYKQTDNNKKLSKKAPQIHRKNMKKKQMPPEISKEHIEFSVKTDKIVLLNGKASVYYTLTNLSNHTYENLFIESKIPSTFKLIKAEPQPENVPEKNIPYLEWKLPKLAAGEKIVFKANLRANGGGHKSISGIVTAYGKQWHANAFVAIK